MSTIETQLGQLYDTLDTTIIVPIKDLNTKKREKTMTIAEYDELQKKTVERKKIERDDITPLENKLFLLKLLKTEPQAFEDFKENHNKWFKDSQALFGIYRNLQRGTFCPTSSMMDAMDNCSLKYNATETKEVGTSYSELVYNDTENNVKISFGGVVLNYNQTINGNDELTAKLYYELVCNNESNGQNNDTMTLSTLGIKVSESNDLKARVAYQGVVNKIKQLYDNPIPNSNDTSSEEIIELEGESIEINPVKKSKQQKENDKQIRVIKNMWTNLQYQFNRNNFNELLSATALKTMGDYLQECQACFKWGGYVSSAESFPPGITGSVSFDTIRDKLIFRSVSQGGSIVPYDENGNALRLGLQGDRPSGFRSIYILLNGKDAVNDQAITGYMFTSSTQNPSRSLLVSRNMNKTNDKQLEGNVIFVTRELQTPKKEDLLKELEFLNVKDKTRKVYGEEVTPEISGTTIDGSPQIQRGELIKNPNTKLKPLKNSSYRDWIDYETSFEPQQETSELEIEETDREREMRLRREERNRKTMEEAASVSAARMVVSIAKRKETSAEKKEADDKITNLNTKIDEEMEKISEENTKFDEEIKKKIASLDALAGKRTELGRSIKDLTGLQQQLETETNRQTKTERQVTAKEANIAKITKAIEELDGKLNTNDNYKTVKDLQESIKLLQGEQETLNEPIKQLEAEKNDLVQKLKSKKGGTISNKKSQIHKITKRQSKSKNKLTKRKKKGLKIPRKTRKNI